MTRRNVITPEIRGELDQTPEWWASEYQKLVNACFEPVPFDPAEHSGHSIVEFRTYGGVTVRQECTECATVLRPRTAEWPRSGP